MERGQSSNGVGPGSDQVHLAIDPSIRLQVLCVRRSSKTWDRPFPCRLGRNEPPQAIIHATTM